MKKFFFFLDRWLLALLVIATALFFILGVNEISTGNDLTELLHASMRLITLDSPDSGYGLYFNFSLNLVFAWALIKIYTVAAGVRLDRLLAKYILRDHIIIFVGAAQGAGDKPSRGDRRLALALDLASSLSKHRKIVLVAPDVLSESQLQKLWKKGVSVLSTLESDLDALQNAGAVRAGMLLAMRDKDEENLTLSRAALSLIDNELLLCKCMLDEAGRNCKINAEDFFESETLPRLRLFSPAELLARHVMQNHPPEHAIATTGQRVHLVLFDLNAIGEAVIEQLARIGHYRSGLPPKVTIFGLGVSESWLAMQSETPGIEQLVEVDVREVDLALMPFNMIEQLFLDVVPPTMIYVFGSNELQTLRVIHFFIAQRASIPSLGDNEHVDVVAIDLPGRSLLKELMTGMDCRRCFYFSSLSWIESDDVCGEEVGWPLVETDDLWAQALHRAFCAKDSELIQKNAGSVRSPNNRPWQELSEEIRAANRAVADHFEVKARAVGCNIIESGRVEEAELSEAELEVLAVMEHNRWWANKLLSGWNYGDIRNDNQRVHPNMVPYDRLTESDRQKDRDSVLEMKNILSSEGKAFVRT